MCCCYICICRYMSLTENKYIRYFGGHDKRVVTMAMNPADETFLSGELWILGSVIRDMDTRYDTEIL